MFKTIALLGLLLSTGPAFAGDCTVVVAQEAITHAMKGDGLFPLALMTSNRGSIKFEVNQSNMDESQYVVEISYVQGDSKEPIATNSVRMKVTDFTKCTVEAVK